MRLAPKHLDNPLYSRLQETYPLLSSEHLGHLARLRSIYAEQKLPGIAASAPKKLPRAARPGPCTLR